jgi:GNAT superfamily N-acetyltransferase
LKPFLEKLVRLEVTGTGFTLREATPVEAQAWWDLHRRQGPRLAPRLDTSVRDLVDLAGRGFADLPIIGAKAAQLAELMRVDSTLPNCPGAVPTPAGGLAVPLVHSLEHFHASGADAVLARWQADPSFAVDPRVRAKGLAEVRAAITKHPVDAALVAAIEAVATARFGTERFRMRSSSNTEDLAEFSGAGLYASVSGAIGDPKHRVDDGLRAVWSSLWDQRAYDERELALVDHTKAAMGVLIHDAFDQVERANGVAVSRDVLEPTNAESFTINAQAGEAAVTNPAPGVVSDQILYTPYLTPPAEYRARSSLANGPVLSAFEMSRLFCELRAIHDHFRVVLDPEQKNRWFAMEIEFKLVEDERLLVIKQARPYSFGNAEIPTDCREY